MVAVAFGSWNRNFSSRRFNYAWTLSIAVYGHQEGHGPNLFGVQLWPVRVGRLVFFNFSQ